MKMRASSIVGIQAFHGYIGNSTEALLVMEAARNGRCPLVTTRLTDAQCTQIKSGSIFVFSGDNENIRRWTDGKPWSSSRAHTPFLLYFELECRHRRKRHVFGITDLIPSATTENGRAEVKKGGLIKKTLSHTFEDNVKMTIVSYYAEKDIPKLTLPSSNPIFQNVHEERATELSSPFSATRITPPLRSYQSPPFSPLINDMATISSDRSNNFQTPWTSAQTTPQAAPAFAIDALDITTSYPMLLESSSVLERFHELTRSQTADKQRRSAKVLERSAQYVDGDRERIILRIKIPQRTSVKEQPLKLRIKNPNKIIKDNTNRTRLKLRIPIRQNISLSAVSV